MEHKDKMRIFYIISGTIMFSSPEAFLEGLSYIFPTLLKIWVIFLLIEYRHSLWIILSEGAKELLDTGPNYEITNWGSELEKFWAKHDPTRNNFEKILGLSRKEADELITNLKNQEYLIKGPLNRNIKNTEKDIREFNFLKMEIKRD